MLGWCSLAADADLAEEAVAHAGPLDQVPADDLEHLQAPHERVLGEVDHAHPAAAQLAEDLVVGVVGQARGQGVGRGRRRRRPGRRRASTGRRAEETDRAADSGRRLGVAEPAEEAVGRQLGDPAPAVGARLQVLVDRLGRGVVELAQAVGTAGSGRSGGGRRGVHEIGLRLRVRDTADGRSLTLIEKGRNTRGTCRENAKLFRVVSEILSAAMGHLP